MCVRSPRIWPRLALRLNESELRRAVWREQLVKRVAANPQTIDQALAAAEAAAGALWAALDGIRRATVGTGCLIQRIGFRPLIRSDPVAVFS